MPTSEFPAESLPWELPTLYHYNLNIRAVHEECVVRRVGSAVRDADQNFRERQMNVNQTLEKQQDENWCVFYRQKQGNKDAMFFVCN